MAHGHDLPGLAVEFDADNTRKVLAEVVNRLAVGGGHHSHGLAHLVGLDRGTVVRRDGGGDFQRFGRGVVPIADFLRGIVGLAVIQIRQGPLSLTCHVASVPMVSVVPSVYSMRSSASRA